MASMTASSSSPRPNPRVFFDIQIGDTPAGQLVFELRADAASRTCENFRILCTGENGKSPLSGHDRTFQGCMYPLAMMLLIESAGCSKFTRIIPGVVCQAGDITKKDNTGGESIYEGKGEEEGEGFKDESFVLQHVGPGVLTMANAGPDSNRSQFFITFAKVEMLDFSHVAFGYVVEGMDVLRKIERLGTSSGRPLEDVFIASCGQLPHF